MTASDVVIVGGGISGIAAAVELATAGVACTLFDRGRRLGGRLAVRTLRDTNTKWDGHPVDVGAAFFTVREPLFAAQVDDWEKRGLAFPWTDTLGVAGPEGLTHFTSGVMRWSAPAGLRSLVDDLAAAIPSVDIRSDRAVESVSVSNEGVHVDELSANLALLCGPDPQMARILAQQSELDEVRSTLASVAWEPVLALTAVYEKRSWPEISGVFVNDSDELGFIADDGSRRGDMAPVLVAHSSSAFAVRHLDDPQAAAPAMMAAMHRILGVTAEPVQVHVQRWSLARPATGRVETHLLDPSTGIGCAGDAWHGGPRIEAAWLSGHSLGQSAVSQLTSG
ncbi:MAG: FAD-dependent oxidoreductase [Actinobacteria bacterium]|nr:FAD-dependent oxidoreductase [Actinomycetota bacterium]